MSGRLAIDGGWVDKVPAGPARLLGADVVVAISVSDDLGDTEGLDHGHAVLARGDAIRARRLEHEQLLAADLVVHVPLKDIGWADFPLAAQAVEAGASTARERLGEIEALLRGSRPPGRDSRSRRTLPIARLEARADA